MCVREGVCERERKREQSVVHLIVNAVPHYNNYNNMPQYHFNTCSATTL